MNQQKALSSNRRLWQALSGILFAVFFLAGDIIRGMLASAQLPMPGAPAANVARYLNDSQTAVLGTAVVHMLSAISLFVFVACVVAFVRQTHSEAGVLSNLTRAAGVLAAVFLLLSVLFRLALIPVAAGGNLALVGSLHTLQFITGGTLHVALLGVFVGAASIAARKVKALPAWINWLGIVTAVLSILSLFSLVFFYATPFIPIGRLLAFVWCIAVGIVLVRGKQRAPAVGSDQRVLS